MTRDVQSPPVGMRLRETTATLRLAAPMAVTQLGQVAMLTTDLMLLGRLGDAVVAAAALAHTVLFGVFVIGMGLVAAVAPVASQAFGAREPRQVRRALRAGLWIAVLAAVPLTLPQLHAEALLIGAGQEPEVAALAQRYLWGLAWCLAPGWAFIAFRNFMGAVGRPEPALWITLVAVPANGLLAYLLIGGVTFGPLSVPPLDLLGAGIATSLVNFGMCIAAAVISARCRPFRKYHVLGRLWRADWPLLGRLVWIGLPISLILLMEYGLFAIAALLMGNLGTAPLAAHQIALQIASILFMVPFGIAQAATVRVGHAIGRRDGWGARSAGFTAILLAAAFMALMTALVAASRDVLPLLFLEPGPANADTIALASMLLALGLGFFIADGVQVVGVGALRGLNDTRVPLVLAAVSFWVLGLPAAVGLAFWAGYGPAGVWLGLTAGILCYAVLLVVRFDLLTRAGRIPATADLTRVGEYSGAH